MRTQHKRTQGWQSVTPRDSGQLKQYQAVRSICRRQPWHQPGTCKVPRSNARGSNFAVARASGGVAGPGKKQVTHAQQLLMRQAAGKAWRPWRHGRRQRYFVDTQYSHSLGRLFVRQFSRADALCTYPRLNRFPPSLAPHNLERRRKEGLDLCRLARAAAQLPLLSKGSFQNKWQEREQKQHKAAKSNKKQHKTQEQ